MNFLEFNKQMSAFPAFSVKEIEKQFPGFDKRRLVEWQNKGYLQKIRNNYYYLTGRQQTEGLSFYIANLIYRPSYVSMESALSLYGFIPQGVFQVISCSSLKTAAFTTPAGNFKYRHIKPVLYFGFRLERIDDYTVVTASPEKTLIDCLYLTPSINSEEDIAELRWNRQEITDKVSMARLADYQRYISSKTLDKRIQILKAYLNA